jgi:hypothetical protein
MNGSSTRKARRQTIIEIVRQDSKVEFSIGEQYKKMLLELSKASKLKMSEISRDIFEPAIKRRYGRMLRRLNKSQKTPQNNS